MRGGIENEISKLWIDTFILEWLGGELLRTKEGTEKLEKKISEKLKIDLKKLENRKNGLIDMRADNEITKDEYLDKRAEINQKIKDIDGQLLSLQIQEISIEDEIEIIMDLVGSLNEKWSTYTDEQKVEILHLMTKNIILGKDGKNKLNIQWKKPWDVLIKKGSTEKKWHAQLDSYRTDILNKSFYSELVKLKKVMI